MTNAADEIVDPVVPGTIPIYERPSTNFSLFVEGRPGGTGSPIGTSTFNWDPSHPSVLPYLLIEVSQPLGNATTAVCDDGAFMPGGVPAVAPPDFSVTQPIADTINDFACRFKDGAGGRNGRGKDEACTMYPDGSYHFVFPPGPGVTLPSTIQFCGYIGDPIAFPTGDTLVTARIRDLADHISAPAQLIIRVLP